MVFEVRHSLQNNYFMVDGGIFHKMDIQVYSSTFKSISVYIIHVISHKYYFKQLCVDIGNSFPNVCTKEKVYTSRSWVEFVEYEVFWIIIKNELYGLYSVSVIYHVHIADTLLLFIFL